jgi:predicted amidohydrolase YtcJ
MDDSTAVPDLLLLDARLPGPAGDAGPPVALLLRHGRIAAVGPASDLRALAGPRVATIDLAGRQLLPAFTDAHFHFYAWALGRHGLALAGLPSLAALRQTLAAAAHAAPAGHWIQGQGWNETAWDDPQLPSRADLDAVAPDHPVILWRADLHLAVANSRALAAGGITEHTPDPPHGVIDRTERGRPTGILRELAINLLTAAIPPPTEDETVTAMQAAAPHLHRLGITGLHDFRLMGGSDGPPAFRAYHRLHAAGRLPLRIWTNLPGERLDEAIALGLRTGLGDDFLRVGHLKFFADGGQGARTAWMLDPYLDTGACGLPLTPVSELAAAITRAHVAGLAVAVHAIGDRANRELVSLFEALPADRPPPAAPHRIEHVQLIRPADVQRLGQLPVVASVQPRHLVDDLALMAPTVGDRARFAYPFRSLAAAGVPLAFGSDCPVADPDPLLGIQAAVTRQRPDGTPAGGWYPAERLTVGDALRAYTLGPAVASGQAGRLGAIAPGLAADLVVLDRDLFAVDPAEIHTLHVALTILAGQVVYDAL